MYNDNDRKAENTLASAIRQSFANAMPEISEENRACANVVKTADMLDYSRLNFNKAFKINIEKSIDLKSKYSLKYLGTVCIVQIGGTPARLNPQYFQGDNLWVSIAEMQGQVITDTKEKITNEAIANSNVKLVPKGTTLLSFKLSIGKTAIAGTDLYTNEAVAALIPINKNEILDGYLFHLFNSKLINLENVSSKAFGKSLNSTYLRDEVKIPVPPVSVQQKIVDECDKIDEIYNSTRMSIEDSRNKIENLFNELDAKQEVGNKLNLSDKKSFTVSIGKRVLNNELVSDGSIPVYSANVFVPFGYVDKLLITDFTVDSVLWGIDGDWMVNFMPQNIPFYPTDHCGVLRIMTDKVNPRYMARILEREGRKLNFSRNYRASIDRIEGITFDVPPINIQNEIVDKIIKLETKIKKLEENLLDVQTQKLDVLRKFL